MLSSTVLTLAIAGLLSLATSAPTTEPVRTATDRSSWVSVDFQGTTIQYDPAALVVNNTPATALESRGTPTADDSCGSSTFSGGDGPYPLTNDCRALVDWLNTQNSYFSIWTLTPDYHGVVGSGSCEFGAGTKNIYDTYVGSHDISQLVSDSIAKFATKTLVGAKGVMGCQNQCSAKKKRCGQSSVFWTVYHS
ncbi:hypothetical protein V492_02160 [Pseudogymnoascus sp. VKM F-4246]|nr:hypothetical protein V492_02160 [Pseudogymnoascus sp. VKM F-4246]